jgi:enterochelin esterase-like enzyme
MSDADRRDGDASPATVADGPAVHGDQVVFRVADPGRELREVRLCQELWRPRDGPAFSRVPTGDTWTLTLPRPPVDRMEYQLWLRRADTSTAVVCDPANPLRAPGAFGEKSVIEFPGYRPPAWLQNANPGLDTTTPIAVRSRVLGCAIPGLLWSSPGARPGASAPLLVVHDGPEYARFSSLLALLATAVEDGRLPSLRAALLTPPRPRDEHYAASPGYAHALVSDVMPVLDALAPSPRERRWRVGMGASLGALALLHAHRAAPEVFGALLLQSGSFFQEHLDPQEAWRPVFARISAFVAGVLAGRGPARPPPVTLTCGTAEENLANNRAVHDALHAQGYRVRLGQVRDAHNWTAWRDAFDPYLLDLLGEEWQCDATT